MLPFVLSPDMTFSHGEGTKTLIKAMLHMSMHANNASKGTTSFNKQ